MGPCVGFDSLQIAVTPPVSEAEARTVRAWHRDMWALPGWSDDYLPPNAVNVLTYLQEGPEYGHLLVLPGSHRGRRLVGAGGPGALQAGEQAVELAAGDTVVVHSSLLHSTSGNCSGRLRIFASYFYTRCWLPKRDAYGMQSMQREIRAARARGDRRLARLFEPDRELLARRASGDRGEHTERELWRRWRQEERAERERGAAGVVAGTGQTRHAPGQRAAPANTDATPPAGAGSAAPGPRAASDAAAAAAPGATPAVTGPARTHGATTPAGRAGSGDRVRGSSVHAGRRRQANARFSPHRRWWARGRPVRAGARCSCRAGRRTGVACRHRDALLGRPVRRHRPSLPARHRHRRPRRRRRVRRLRGAAGARRPAGGDRLGDLSPRSDQRRQDARVRHRGGPSRDPLQRRQGGPRRPLLVRVDRHRPHHRHPRATCTAWSPTSP